MIVLSGHLTFSFVSNACYWYLTKLSFLAFLVIKSGTPNWRYIRNHSLVRFISIYPLTLKFKFLNFRAWNPHQMIQRRNMNASVGVATISQQVCWENMPATEYWTARMVHLFNLNQSLQLERQQRCSSQELYKRTKRSSSLFLSRLRKAV